MIYRGRAYFYQSGLVYDADKRGSPGLVCLARTIEYCLEQGQLQEFHLMAGGDHYKEPMSTDRQELEWVVFQRPSLKNKTIRSLQQWKRRILPGPQPAATPDATEPQHKRPWVQA